MDNGLGMTQEELILSMRIGSNDPSVAREEADLGRFGMGMKTAAFSLGKKLTVVTKANKDYANACWDIENIEHNQCGWDLNINDDSEIVQIAKTELVAYETGTMVIIEKLDSLIGSTNLAKSKKNFYKVISNIENHLRLVFHRFIEEDDLHITINENSIRAWNPFVLDSNATQELAEEIYYAEEKGPTVIQPYVLPHKSKFSSPEKFKEAEGVYGWNTHQGIYVYRNRRLLVYGTWFGIIKKEPAFDLARIKLDFLATHDFDWQIDIKKSKATPPIYIKELLEQIIIRCTEASARVYNSRGSYSKGPAMPNLDYVWEQRKNSLGRFSFYLNKKHSLLNTIKKSLGTEKVAVLNAYLALVENYSPVLQSGVIDYMQGSNMVQKIDDLEKQQDIICLKKYIQIFGDNDFSKDEIKATLLGMKNYSYLKQEIIALLEDESND